MKKIKRLYYKGGFWYDINEQVPTWRFAADIL